MSFAAVNFPDEFQNVPHGCLRAFMIYVERGHRYR